MRRDVNHSEVIAKPETLGDDFALILEAIVDAFRLSDGSSGCHRPSVHYAGWR